MTFRAALAALLIACASFGASAAAAAEPSATIVSFGRYEARDSGQTVPAERTASGILRPADSHRLIERTDVIVGQLGTTFGIELRLENFPPGVSTVTIRTLHPPLTNPKTGKTMTVSEYEWSVTPSENPYFCFSFDEGWEVGEGEWTTQVIYNGKVIAEKKFKIVVPLN